MATFAPGPYKGPQRRNMTEKEIAEMQRRIAEIEAKVMDTPHFPKPQ